MSSGTDLNGNTILDSKYYNAYSYGTSSYDQVAYNRSRLGDAIAEAIGGIDSNLNVWHPGTGIIGAYAEFVDNNMSWIVRSGGGSSNGSTSFYFDNTSGGIDSVVSFRLSIS